MWQNWAFRAGTAVVGALLVAGATIGIAGAAGGLHLGRLAGHATPPVSKVAATNPDGHCVLLPSVSDIIKHPEKHPGWYVIGGLCCTAPPTPTPAATATPTPTPP